MSYSDLSGWESDDFKMAMPSLLKSCKTPTPMFSKFCYGLNKYQYASSAEIKNYIESTLNPYQVISYSSHTGTITGYYEAELTGTRHRVNKNQMPVYGLPYGYKKGKKYPEREDIEEDGIDAPIIAWANDPVELFILHVQGSGRMITPTGEIKLGYAGNNSREFVKLSTLLKKYGAPTLYSMPAMKKWLQDNPEKAKKIMSKNPRFIFFKENTNDSPIGAAGVVLTPMRSVAVDKNYIPMHTPMWLSTKDPDGYKLERLVVAQDIGSAIKGGIRADFFWGHGELAFSKAGRMNSQGSYYLLLPKD
jgi:membrane-bound lytic murein transglycosylase A